MRSANQWRPDGERGGKQPRSLRSQGSRAGAGASAAGSPGSDRFRREPGVYRRLITPAIKKPRLVPNPARLFCIRGQTPNTFGGSKCTGGLTPMEDQGEVVEAAGGEHGAYWLFAFCDVYGGYLFQEFFHEYLQFHPGQGGAGAYVDAGAVEQVFVGVLVRAVAVRVAEFGFVPVGGGPEDGDFLAGRNGAAADFDFAGGYPAVGDQRSIHAQDFVDGFGQQLRCGFQVGQ